MFPNITMSALIVFALFIAGFVAMPILCIAGVIYGFGAKSLLIVPIWYAGSLIVGGVVAIFEKIFA